MNRKLSIVFLFLIFAIMACASNSADNETFEPEPTRAVSVFDTGQTVYGFFSTPPQPTTESILANIQAISQHGDVLLLQEAVPWDDFIEEENCDSPRILEKRELLNYLEAVGLEVIFVVDPLNGLDRSEFLDLPSELASGDFSTPKIRLAYQNFVLCLVQEFQPKYLGLASEINTYLDAHPGDQENFLSLYRETYIAINTKSPETQVFVTFQWDDLNRLDGDGEAFDIKWEQIELFEPQLDLWVISSYPGFYFDQAVDIPVDYYTPLLARTSKPLAVAEGGWTSQDVSVWAGTDQDQIDYLRAIDAQIGQRLVFWINLLYADLDWKSYRQVLRSQGVEEDLETLSLFAHLGLVEIDGTPKPALAIWDEIRNRER